MPLRFTIRRSFFLSPISAENSTAIRFKLIIGRPLVYVIGLHAVQFGNNWTKKIPRTAKIGRGRFEFNYFQIGQHVVLLHILHITYSLQVNKRRTSLALSYFGIISVAD